MEKKNFIAKQTETSCDIVYKHFSCFRPGMGQFFSLSHLSTLVTLFSYIIRKYLSHILFWSQLIVYKRFSWFRPGMGQFFFIVTLVYTCHTFFAASSENICPIYCFVHSSSQSVSQPNSFLPLKYIVYKRFNCFRPRMGHFFSLSHLSTLVTLFCSIIRKCLSHIYLAASSRVLKRKFLYITYYISLYNILC